MVDRPILFSGPMVLALLAGRKTQTRRVHFTQSPAFVQTCNNRCDQRLTTMCILPAPTCGRRSVTKARFAVGDRLWVRETVACGACAPSPPSHWAPSFWRREQGTPANPNGLWYAADGLAPAKPITERGRWRPGIHMPRWASRLTLAVTDVRVERLQDIGEDDAIAEGCGQYSSAIVLHRDRPFEPQHKGCYREGFSELWEGLNASRGYGWEANP